MTFTKCGDCYLSGNGRYKVVQYGSDWYAYFKPDGWEAFGNSCERSPRGSGRYPSAEAAKAAAQRHFDQFGLNADAHNRINLP